MEDVKCTLSTSLRLSSSLPTSRATLSTRCYRDEEWLFGDLQHTYTLQYTAVYHYTLQYTTTHYSILQYTTTHYSILQYTTTHYSTLQYTTVHLPTPESFWLSMCTTAPKTRCSSSKVTVSWRGLPLGSSLDSQNVSVEPSVRLLLMASFEDTFSLPAGRMFSIRLTSTACACVCVCVCVCMRMHVTSYSTRCH